jgi:hypothetical protein
MASPFRVVNGVTGQNWSAALPWKPLCGMKSKKPTWTFLPEPHSALPGALFEAAKLVN